MICGTASNRASLLRNTGVRPNKRLKLPGPAFRGSVCLCASEPIPQDGALAPAGARPAA
jgi:hypothetical protein